MASGFSRTLPFLLLALLVLAAYGNSFGAGLIFDNRVVIVEDARVHAVTLDNLRLILGKTYWWPTIPTALYRPATTLTYLLNYAVLGNGAQPFGYHAVNLLLHLANVLLVFTLAARLARSTWIAFTISAIWAAHPLLTEAVTNVVGRADLLASFGILAALWCHVRASDASAGGDRTVWWWRSGVALAAIVGVFAKENAVAVAAIIPLWDILVARRGRSIRELWSGWLAIVPAIVLFLVARALVLAGEQAPIYPFVDNPIVGASWWQGRLTALAVIADYLRLVAWPLSLSCDYSFPQIPLVSGGPSDLMRLGITVASVAICVAAAQRSRALAFVASGAFLVFLPASNLLFASGTIMAERLVYLPSIAPIAVVVAAVAQGASRLAVPRPVVATGALVIVALLAVGTLNRNSVWRDELTLWTGAVEASPRSFKTHGALAEALYGADPTRANLPDVIAHKERSLALLAELPDPLLVSDVYGQAATYYLERGDWLRQHEPSKDADARAAYSKAAEWAARFVSAVEANRPGAQPPSARQRAAAQLLLSTATLKAQDPQTAVAAAHRGRMTDPFRSAAYQAEAAALVEARRDDDAAIALLAGFMVTGDAALRSAVMEMYRAGLDRDGCAVSQGPSGPALNQQCDIVRRHVCAASAEAASVFTAAGRSELAERTMATARQQFGCGGI